MTLLYVAALIFATQLTLGGRLRHQSADQPALLLFYGNAKTLLVRVEPDARYPGMWRMHWPSGEISDLASLARIKDAAVVLCERGPPARNPQRLHWKTDRSESLYGGRRWAGGGAGYPEAGPARSWGYRPPAVGLGKRHGQRGHPPPPLCNPTNCSPSRMSMVLSRSWAPIRGRRQRPASKQFPRRQIGLTASTPAAHGAQNREAVRDERHRHSHPSASAGDGADVPPIPDFLQRHPIYRDAIAAQQRQLAA